MTALLIALQLALGAPCDRAHQVGAGHELQEGDAIPCTDALIVPTSQALTALQCLRADLPSCQTAKQEAAEIAAAGIDALKRQEAAQRIRAEECEARAPCPAVPETPWYQSASFWAPVAGVAGVVLGVVVGVTVAD
jgi:hypothetical protein